MPDDVFDLYCWIHSTYTIPRALSLHVGTEVAHPGVMASNVDEEEERRYVSYYQWVGFCLFFQVNRHLHNNHIYISVHLTDILYILTHILLLQSILFYIPRWLWKNWEAGKITALLMDLDVGVISEVEKKQKKKLLLDYLYDNLKNHNWWAYRYFFCELLAFLNIIGEYILFGNLQHAKIGRFYISLDNIF